MELIIKIPDYEIPKRQEIVSIGVHFIDGKICECTYPFKEVKTAETELEEIKKEISDIYCVQYSENPITADEVKELVLEIIDNNINEMESQTNYPNLALQQKSYMIPTNDELDWKKNE